MIPKEGCPRGLGGDNVILVFSMFSFDYSGSRLFGGRLVLNFIWAFWAVWQVVAFGLIGMRWCVLYQIMGRVVSGLGRVMLGCRVKNHGPRPTCHIVSSTFVSAWWLLAVRDFWIAKFICSQWPCLDGGEQTNTKTNTLLPNICVSLVLVGTNTKKTNPSKTW
jgi:hypothetical protein